MSFIYIPEERMNWIIATLWSSIGKKLMMAITGFCFICFLVLHLAGNLTVFIDKDLFNAYSAHLHTYGPLINLAELALLFLAVVHVLIGSILFYENFKARPLRYKIKKNAGGRTIGSLTMPYTGFIVLAFVIFHLFNFHFVDKTDTTIFQIVSASFANPDHVILYMVAMVVVAFHISHGFWSLFQTLGANHPKYMPIIMGARIAISLALGIGFGCIPIYISLIS